MLSFKIDTIVASNIIINVNIEQIPSDIGTPPKIFITRTP